MLDTVVTMFPSNTFQIKYSLVSHHILWNKICAWIYRKRKYLRSKKSIDSGTFSDIHEIRRTIEREFGDSEIYAVDRPSRNIFLREKKFHSNWKEQSTFSHRYTHTRAWNNFTKVLITVNSTRKHFIVSFHLFARHAEYNAANNRVPRFSIALRHEKNMTRDTRSSFVTPYTCRHTFPHIQEGEGGTGFPSSKLIS